MSGIYIPSMEMPTRCYNCKIDCGLVSHIDRNMHPFWRYEKCPLVPVPDHGRLIDSNEIQYNKIMLVDDEFYFGVTKPYIDRMPTIIPADKEE